MQAEYEKLHSALQKSHEGEKRLMGKCRELNAELVAAAARVESVADDQPTDDSITEMEKQLEYARESISEYRARESQLKDQILHLKEDIEDMSIQLEEGTAAGGGGGGSKTEDVSELIRNKKHQPAIIEDRLIKLEERLKMKFSNCFESVRKAFLLLDGDYDGFITIEDILKYFGNEPDLNYNDLKKLIFDKD